MNKLPFYIIFFMMISSYSFSQSTSQNANASIFLLAPISITPSVGDLDFGEIILTGSSFTEIIAPSGGKLFVVEGTAGRSVSIFFNSIVIDNVAWVSTFGGTADNITFTPDVELDDGTNVNSGDSHPLEDVSGLGELNLWVGGSIFIAANQAHGDYTGLFTVTVSY